MPFEQNITKRKYTGHVSAKYVEGTKYKDSVITYIIFPFEVSMPDINGFENDLSLVVQKLFAGESAMPINSRSLVIDIANVGNLCLGYGGTLFGSDVSVGFDIAIEPGSERESGNRQYSVGLQVLYQTGFGTMIKQRVEATLFPILDKYAVPRLPVPAQTSG